MNRRRQPEPYFDLVFKLGTPLALALGLPAAFYAAKSESILFDELFVLVASGWGYALAALVAEWREKERQSCSISELQAEVESLGPEVGVPDVEGGAGAGRTTARPTFRGS